MRRLQKGIPNFLDCVLLRPGFVLSVLLVFNNSEV